MGTLQNNLKFKETLHNKVNKLAKESKAKYSSTLNKAQLCLALGMEPIPTSEKYERFCRGKVTLVMKKTGEKREFTSIYKAAKAIGKNPGSISYRLNKNNVEIKSCENTYFIHSEHSDRPKYSSCS